MANFKRWLHAIGLIFILSTHTACQHFPTDELYCEEPISITPCASHPSGLPVSSFCVEREGYCLAYDACHRNPCWIYEHLTAESLAGDTDRDHCDFKEDEKIPKHLRATPIDYRGQGFDRGHLAPAANHRASPAAMADTFYMTNICPQSPQLNRGYWSKLEKHVRNLTETNQAVYVVTGPLYLPQKEADGKRYVKYQVIGRNDVAVPTHFFKVITVENWQGKRETQAYILPNTIIASNTDLQTFKTKPEKVEKLAGLILPHK